MIEQLQKMSAEQLKASTNMIIHAGNAKSNAMEALNDAKQGHFKEAKQYLEEADNELIKAHNEQSALLTDEARGDQIAITLLAVHSQDHLMISTVYNDVVKSLVEVYQMIYANKQSEEQLIQQNIHHGE